MKRHGNIVRSLTRVLALVLTLVFGLSTFHSHANAALGADSGLIAGTDLSGTAGEKAPDRDDRDESAECPVCAVLTHILGSGPTEFAVGPLLVAERYLQASETGRCWLPSEHHRPPIIAAG